MFWWRSLPILRSCWRSSTNSHLAANEAKWQPVAVRADSCLRRIDHLLHPTLALADHLALGDAARPLRALAPFRRPAGSSPSTSVRSPKSTLAIPLRAGLISPISAVSMSVARTVANRLTAARAYCPLPLVCMGAPACSARCWRTSASASLRQLLSIP